MITLLSAAAFVVILAWWWVRWQHDFPALAIRYVCVGPFLPLVSLFNHNFDGDRFGAEVRTLPIYAAVVLLGLSAVRWRQKRLGVEGAFLLVYTGWCLLQVPFSEEPGWALCAWSFSTPGYVLFLMAGRSTRLVTLQRERVRIAATVLAFVGIQVSLVAYGLSVGRAADLAQTRNFGSVWASNTALAFLVLFGGLAWTAVRESAALSFLFLTASIVSMSLSLSRTAVLVLTVYVTFLVSPGAKRRLRVMVGGVAVAASLLVAFVALRQGLNLDEQLVDNWLVRFRYGEVVDAVVAARQGRSEEFAGVVDHVLRGNPFSGTGFGTFKSFSIYSDAHSLLLTEAFENSLVAVGALLLAFGLPRAARALFDPALRPIAVSIFGFLAVAELTGGMLSYRSFDNYYATYPGWILFMMVGILASERATRVTARPMGGSDSGRALERHATAA